jgi:hypothetical protein
MIRNSIDYSEYEIQRSNFEFWISSQNKYPAGTKFSIQYVWHLGKFEIDTYERKFTVSDNEIKETCGKYFFNEIEIPVNVIEQKNALDLDLKLRKGSIGSVKTTQGNVYISLNEKNGQVIARCGEKEAIAGDIEIVENKKAINVQSLGLEFPYIEVPATVENAFRKVKNEKLMQGCSLISVGKSLLTGKEYYKFSAKIPTSEWIKVKNYFEDLGTGRN